MLILILKFNAISNFDRKKKHKNFNQTTSSFNSNHASYTQEINRHHVVFKRLNKKKTRTSICIYKKKNL